MTSKLKCPFCGEKLYSSDNCYVCLNDDCIFCGFHFMEKRWKPIIELKQALIQAKQDLEIARKTLKEYANTDNWGCIEDDRDRNLHTYWYFDGCDDGGWVNAQQALEQIEHKE